MKYVKSFDMFGVEAKEIPCIKGSGAPTTATEGAVGCLYMDTDTGNMYKCTAVDGDVYTWVGVDAVTIEQTANLFNKNDVIDGNYFDYNTGELMSSDSCFCAYIPIDHAGTYQLMVAGNIFGLWGMCQIPCFDSDKNCMGSLVATTTDEVATAENKATLVISEANMFDKKIAYIGLSGRLVSLDKTMVVEADEYPSEYIPYGKEPKLTENMAKAVGEETKKATKETIVKYHKENDINPNNLFVNPLFDGTDGWGSTTGAMTIVEADTFANGVKLVNSGEAVYVYQNFAKTMLQSGRYVVRKKDENESMYKTGFEVIAIGNGITKRIAKVSNSDECVFDLDIEALTEEVAGFSYIKIYLIWGYIGEVIVSEPYFGIDDGYTGFWNVAYGDAVRRKEYTELKVAVDAQSEAANPLYGKIITFNGDSICEARASNGGGYATIIGQNNNMTVENLGVSGGTIMYAEGKHCISRTVANMRADADYIILEGGVNDLYSDRPLGAMSNGYNATLDDTTFYGAFENMLKQALIRFHGKKIGYIAVHKMTPYFDGDKTEDNAYHAAIKCCKKWGIPVCDLNVSCPPFGYLRDNPNTVFIANLYTEHTSTAGVGDGWHPNEEGYRKFYVPKIEAWLKTL